MDISSRRVLEILDDYSDLYAETPESIYDYFFSMMNDKKPAVSIEIYNQPKERTDEFRRKIGKYFFVFGEFRQNKGFNSYHLSVSKVKSIAKQIDALEREGFANNAGAIGYLLGYQLKDCIDYIEKIKEDRIKR